MRDTHGAQCPPTCGSAQGNGASTGGRGGVTVETRTADGPCGEQQYTVHKGPLHFSKPSSLHDGSHACTDSKSTLRSVAWAANGNFYY